MIENINRIDKSFDLNNIDNYHLSLQVHLKGFSFCILDRERNKFIGIGNYTFLKITSYKILLEEIERIINSESIFSYNYQHVKLLFATPKYTLIPSAFYTQEDGNKFYRFNHQISRNEKILENFIYGNSSYVNYSLPGYLYDFFTGKFSNIKIYHQACPHVEEILLKNKLNKSSVSVHINILHDFIDIAVINKEKLYLYNSFAYKTNTDFQYFILNVFDQLELSTLETPVYISGQIQRNHSKIENLKQYIKDIQFLSKPNHFDYSFIFNDIPDHFFLNLINLYQCG